MEKVCPVPFIASDFECTPANENKRDTGYKWLQTVVESVEMMKVGVKIRISLAGGKLRPWGRGKKRNPAKLQVVNSV